MMHVSRVEVAASGQDAALDPLISMSPQSGRPPWIKLSMILTDKLTGGGFAKVKKQ